MLVGKTLGGKFRIEKELGSGAMGTVYKALFTETAQYVALKMINVALVGNEQALGRFEHEAAILKKLRHPNIVSLFATGHYNRAPFIAMEFVQGESLDHVLARRGRFTWEEVVELGKQLCDALQHAHDKGIIHRDLKPSNIMVLRDGTVKLTDFGIAKDPNITALTAANAAVGTASYMSPEQCKGERTLSHKSDLYSLGVVFYELVTGRKPFTADSPIDMFMQHVEGTFERPSRIVFDIPIWLDSLISQMLEKKPEHRPADAAMVRRALEEVVEKVESQLSAGVDAVKARVIDRRAGPATPIDEKDREAARALRGAVTKKKIRKKVVPFYQKVWFQVIAIAAFLAGSGYLVYQLTRPEPPEVMAAAVERAVASGDRDRAIDAVDRYLRVYGGQDTPLTQEVRKKEKRLKVERREAQLQKRFRGTSLKPGGLGPDEDDDAEAYNATQRAWQSENEGELDLARQRWEALAEKYKGESAPDRVMWSWVAAKKLRDLDEAVQADKALVKRTTEDVAAREKRAIDSDLERQAVEAVRLELEGNWRKARDAWHRLKEEALEKLENRQWVLIAARHELDAKEKGDPPREEKKPRDEKKAKDDSGG
jgi:serine/threonine-protein kinase